MTMTDPIADMFTRIRNANSAKLLTASMPYSKFKEQIAKILEQQGYILGYEVTDAKVGKNLIINLKYSVNNDRAIVGIRRISSPGLRKYAASGSLPEVLGGLGIAIVSTSHGLMTATEAKLKKIGGEIVGFVW